MRGASLSMGPLNHVPGATGNELQIGGAGKLKNCGISNTRVVKEEKARFLCVPKLTQSVIGTATTEPHTVSFKNLAAKGMEWNESDLRGPIRRASI